MGHAKQATLIPLKACATLALHRRHTQLLRSLGEQVPAAWGRAEEQVASPPGWVDRVSNTDAVPML